MAQFPGISLIGNWLTEANLVPLAVAVIAVFLLMSSLRRKQKASGRETVAPAVPREHGESGSRADMRRDIDALLVELQELSRKISADIDMRFAKLEVVIQAADRRIAALSRLTRQGGSSGEQKPRSGSDLDDRHAVVYELADAGHPVLDIARELGKTPGEVELILNLRKQADASPS